MLIEIILCRSIWVIADVLNPPLVPSQATPPEKWQLDRNAWDAQLQEAWYLDQVEEPLDHTGTSVLARWLHPLEGEGEKGWRCRAPIEGETWCTEEIKRKDRAVIHVRVHLDLKPFPCEGHCKKQNWYAEKPFLLKDPNIVIAPPASLQRSIVMLIVMDRTTKSVNGGKSETLELVPWDYWAKRYNTAESWCSARIFLDTRTDVSRNQAPKT
jgi:hypothetical protein